ncbi:hypothetical protein FQN52_006464 [Onygenales sp. PD_12]|nr:hypothetical protein FQN52_006464 [Onygenales sp. PD_12]
MAGRRTSTARRGRQQKPTTAASDGEPAPGSSSPALAPTDLLKSLDHAVEKRNKDKRQKLRAQHKAQVRKAEEEIRAAAQSDKLALSKYRRAQIKRLSELVKRRTEIELDIAAHTQKLNDLYEAVHGDLSFVLEHRLSSLG